MGSCPEPKTLLLETAPIEEKVCNRVCKIVNCIVSYVNEIYRMVDDRPFPIDTSCLNNLLMDQLNCAIVEDDKMSLLMVTALAEKTGFINIEATFSAPDEAMLWLAKHEVDLLFLDVEMPGMTGLEMLRALLYKPEVIVISSKPGYAVEAFDLSVTDYLIKPVQDYVRFLAAVNKVIAKRAVSRSTEPGEDNLFVKMDSLLLKLDVDDMLWIEAFGDYIKIQTTEKTYTVYSTLKKLEEKLVNKKFVRVHRSYIVNISKISNIDPNNLEINRKIIPISATYKEDLLSRIKIL